MCISDAALTCFENVNGVAAIVEEAKEIAKNFTFSSMVCMFALSTVIQCGIQSYYPTTIDNVTKENWDSLAKMFNCTIHPRDHIDGSEIDYLHIFRCAPMPPSFLVDRKIPSTKNHFVALCKPIKAPQPGDQYFKAHVPTLVKSAMPVKVKVPHTVSKVSSVHPSTPVITTTTTKQTTVTKRKQISLNTLFLKRACNTQGTTHSEIKCVGTLKGISSVTSNAASTSEPSTKQQLILCSSSR